MARPQKKGLNYFPKDVDTFSDRKIKILMARYGADGYTLYDYLLCEIYKEGYFLKIDDDFNFIVSSDLHMSAEKIGQMMNFLLERSLFNDTLFKSDKVLTSVGIQRRYQAAKKSNAQKTPVTVDERLWLLSHAETQSFIKLAKNQSFSSNNHSYSEKNANKSEKNRPKEKESKINENKEKERKERGCAISVSKTESVINLFNGICVDIPKVSALSVLDTTYILQADVTLNGAFKEFFQQIQASDFLTGRSGKWNGCSFQWILKPDNIQKILKGNYDNTEIQTTKSKYASFEAPSRRSYNLQELEEMEMFPD